MQRNVVVSVKGSFAVTGSGIPESPEVEVITEGEYFEQGNLKCITYEERDPQFPEPIRNIISINGQQVTMKKRGLINTDMTFRKSRFQRFIIFNRDIAIEQYDIFQSGQPRQ